MNEGIGARLLYIGEARREEPREEEGGGGGSGR
jgi:hypothetical protein